MDTDALGHNIEFPIYKQDGTSFEGLVLRKATFDSVVMSFNTKITGDVFYISNNLPVTMQEYVVYNGVKYTIVNPPTIVRNGLVSDNSELKGMTKYTFEFYHPMYQLSNLPFYDVAVTNDSKRYLSENREFSWIGYPNDFLNKLNKNLQETQWVCEMSSSIPDEKLSQLSSVISFSNNTIADALKAWYDTWELPFIIDQIDEEDTSYADGKRFKIILGYPSNEIYTYRQGQSTGIPYIFRMGQGVGLKNNSRTPRNNKIVTRIAGYGSEDNIQYGYPQIVWTGNQEWDYTINNDASNILSYPIYDGIVNGEYVRLIKHPFTRTHLMPSIYRECVDKKVNPYNEDYNPNTQLIDYYDAIGDEYLNQINPLAPSYESHEFQDVKPELGETSIVDSWPLTKDLERDTTWDDSMNENGEYVQSFFKVKLPVLGFDLYACAAITQSMKLNMRSGACLGCTFEVQVDWEAYKASFYDEDGNFSPDGEQRDTDAFPDSRTESIEIILKKENQTFGTVMPNRYQTPKAGDEYVILGISLPSSYIYDAESRLDEEMKAYMKLNNIYYFDYPLKFDELFLVNNKEILSQIHLNTSVRFMFNDVELQLFVKQISIKYGESPLPKYDITLTDNIEVATSPLGQVNESVDKLAALIAQTRKGSGGSGSGDASDKLSRINDDEAHGLIGFIKGAWFGTRQWFIDMLGNANLNDVVANGILRAYNAVINRVKSSNFSGFGMLDSGWQIINDYEGQDSYAVFDRLYVRKKAIFEELELRKISHIGGDFCLSPASGRVWRVECYDSEVGGELLGYDIYTVPYTLGGRVLALFSHSLANRFFSRKRKLERQLTTEELARVKRIRVYMFSDDGTTKTMQNWTVGAQARCQTFNIETQMEHISGGESDNPDVDYWTGKKAQNTYWWRMVYSVGEALCEDGKKHAYIEFLENQTNQRTHSDIGSDIPSVGDEFAQFGHRTEPTQQNVIMIETANPDSPAIKFYKGVNSWSVENKRKTVLSPAGTEIYSQRYHIETEYDDVIVPMDRGEWHSGMECHYYDRVSHNGSLWLCIVVDGTSTTEEPSESSTVWIKQVGRGQDATTTAQKYTGPLAEGATKPTISNYKQFTWTDTAPVSTKELPDIYVALWKYTAGTELDINTTPPYSVSLFAHYGDDGKNGTSIVAAPNAIVINQQRVSTGGAEPLTNISYPIVVVARDSGTIVKSTVSNLTTTNCTASITKNNVTDSTVTITAISKYTEGGKEKYRTSGVVSFHVTAQTAKGDTFQADISVPFGCNLLGQYTIDIEEDVKTEVSSKVTSEIDSRNLVNVTEMNTTVQQSAQGLTTEINKVNNRLNAGGDIGDTVAYNNSHVQTAESNISTLTKTINGQPGGLSNTRLDTAESSIQTLNSQMAGNTASALNTKITTAQADISNLQTSTGQMNTRLSTAEGNIQTVGKRVGGTFFDLGNSASWEQGSTSEAYNKTYDEIKTSSTSRIRTIDLISVRQGSDLTITARTNAYNVFVIYFMSSKRVASVTGSGWLPFAQDTTMGCYKVNVALPSNATYIALLMNTGDVNNAASAGLHMLINEYGTKSYIEQSDNNVRLGIIDDLGDTGIDIENGTVKLKGNKVTFTNSAGTASGKIWIDPSNGALHATDADLTGKMTVTSGTNKIIIDSNGFEAKWGGEGIRVGTNGIQRYDSIRDKWLPMYNQRNIVVDSSRRYSRYQLPTDVDFFLNAYQNDSYTKEIMLPSSSSLPDGAIITVRGLRDTLTDVYPSSGDALSLGDWTATHVDVDNADRVDFVLCKGLSPATWLVNYYEIER